MLPPHEIRARVAALRPTIEARYPIRLLGLFGSAARGEARVGSDVDVLAAPRPGLTLFKLGAVRALLEAALDAPVDLVLDEGLVPRAREAVRAGLIDL